MLKRRQPFRLCASRARWRNLGQLFWFTLTKLKKKEEKELGVGAYITGCLLTKPSWLRSSPRQLGKAIPLPPVLLLFLTWLIFIYKNDSLSKWKTIDYLPKKIESPTYEKRSQIELNQVRLQRHNDSRVGISPPSEPDVKVSPHPALRRGISTHCFP